MKLVIAIVQSADCEKVMNSLNKHNFPVTKLASTGGFLRAGNATLIIGTDKDKVDQVIDLIDEKCHSRTELSVLPPVYGMIAPAEAVEVEVGGATVFVLDVDRFERL